MDAAPRRTTGRVPAPYDPLADDVRTDATPTPTGRRPAGRARRVNAVLLVIAVLATVAGVALLVSGDSDPATRPTVDAVDPVADGTDAAAGDPTAPVGEPTPTVPAAERPVLGIGSAGPEVTTLQELLVARGFDPGVVDGQFGPGTAAAVQAFQTSVGLAPDGVVGAETWSALDTAETTTAT